MEGTAGDLISLPDELLIKIFNFLNYDDLCRLSSCCHRLHTLSQHEPLWKEFCQKAWLDEDMKHSQTSWHDNFRGWFNEWGRYVTCYATVRTLWNRIEATLKERCPNVLLSLEGPAIEQELSVVEAQLPCCLPPEVRCSYRIHKGQVLNEAVGGLFGSVVVYQHHSSEYLMTLATQQMLSMIETMIEEHNSVILPLTVCPFSGMTQGLCLQNMPGLQAGQIIYHVPSTQGWSDTEPLGYFLTANSFLEWLTALADQLVNPDYTVLGGRFYKFYHNPSYVATTNDVRVSVSTTFVPELSRVERRRQLLTLFAYRITLSMDENAPTSQSCKLSHRHWEVTDARGKTEVVDGEGVVGQCPVIKPGSKFSWISCTSFDTPYGDMKGWFKVHNLQSGDQYNIICPCFHMESLPVIRVDHLDDTEDEIGSQGDAGSDSIT
ncbi:LOW QUALITY PROTEIN: F-box only protein 3-like [Amphiura filiformis]|uniref:LOW QUALITY PROTEIN: F-box only protein 3-like n=1 Tax=Amphiura filiformis TaxID=82378 RepID=UPI003B226A54